MSVVLSADDIAQLTGLQQPAAQLAELHKQGFWRARIGPHGAVILERPHFEAVCGGGPKERPMPQLRPHHGPAAPRPKTDPLHEEEPILPVFQADAQWRDCLKRSYSMVAVTMHELTQESGVYFLWGADQDLLYVGKATDFSFRIGRHYKDGRIPFRFASTVECSTAIAEHIECGFLYGLTPPFNKKYVTTIWCNYKLMAEEVNDTRDKIRFRLPTDAR